MSGRLKSVAVVIVLIGLCFGLWWGLFPSAADPEPRAEIQGPHVGVSTVPSPRALPVDDGRGPAVVEPSSQVPFNQVPWWEYQQLCVPEPSEEPDPVPSVFEPGSVQFTLIEGVLTGTLTDDLVELATVEELTLATLSDDSILSDRYVAAAIEVNELTRVRWQCTSAMANDHFRATGEYFEGGEQLRPCMEPDVPSALLDTLDEIVEDASDAWLRDRAALLAIDALRQVGTRDAFDQMQQRVTSLILTADNPETIGRAMANIDGRGLPQRDDWPDLQTVVLAEPQLARQWFGIVLAQLEPGRSRDEEQWWDVVRSCHEEVCAAPSTLADAARCTEFARLLERP